MGCAMHLTHAYKHANSHSMYTLLTAPRLFTGLDSQPIEQGAVLIEGDHIVAVGHAADIGVPDGPVQQCDLADGTIIPGLIDTHTHLTCSATTRMVQDALEDDDLTVMVRAVDHAHAALRAGVTTIRDCGSRPHVVTQLRKAIAAGITPGPRMLLCGCALTTTGGHLHFVGRAVDHADDIPKAVREQVAAGADFVKVTGTGGGLVPGNSVVYRQFDGVMLKRIVDEAAQLERYVAVHSLSVENLHDVLYARPRTVEHLTFWRDSAETVAYDPRLVDALAEAGIWGSQVIIGWHRRAHGAQGIRRADLDGATAAKLDARIPLLRDMHARGLKLLAGSDAGMPLTPFDNFGLILDLSVRHIGMTAAQALQVATSEAATALGLADRGVLAPGKVADIAVLAGDPFQATKAFYGALLTLIGGRVVWQRGA